VNQYRCRAAAAWYQDHGRLSVIQKDGIAFGYRLKDNS